MADKVRFEVGKRYRTRDGKEAGLNAVGPSSFGGGINGDSQWHIWSENGWYAGTLSAPFIPNAPHPFDLVECFGELK